MMKDWVEESAHIARALTRRPVYAAAVILSLALGVGASTAAFSLMYGVLLRPLPFADDERLVRVWAADERERSRGDLSLLDFADLDAEAQAFQGMAAVSRVRMVLPDSDAAERLRGEAVTPGYLEILGMAPALGRWFDDAEARGAGGSAVLIAHQVWQDRFGGDPAVVGRSLLSTNDAYRIVGVMPPSFRGTTDEDVVDFWVPLERWYASEHPVRPAFLEEREAAFLRVVARVRQGVSTDEVARELDTVGARLARRHTAADGVRGLWSEPIAESWRSRARPGVLALLGSAVGLLLIGCFNVTSLQVVRSSRRGRELAVRAALGAGRGRILRLVVVEVVVLAALAGALGLVVADGLAGFLAGTLQSMAEWVQLPAFVDVGVGATAVLFGALVSLGSAVVVGLVGGWSALRRTGPDRLRQGARGAAGDARSPGGSAMVTAEVAVALALLVAAGLLLRSYAYLSRMDPGFTDAPLALQVTLNPRTYTADADREAYRAEAERRLAALPGAEGVAVAAPALPLLSFLQVAVAPEAALDSDDLASLTVDAHQVNAGFFPIMDIELREGGIAAGVWNQGQDRIAVVSRSLADALWGDGPAVGRRVRLTGAPGEWEEATVAAVAEDVMWEGPGSRRLRNADLYLPLGAAPPTFFGMAVRMRADALATASDARRAVQSIDPSVPVHWVETIEARLAARASGPGSQATTVVLFSAIALVMALVGVYGIVAFQVERRRAEFGVRIALGARPGNILRLVLGSALTMTGAGLLVGLVLAGLGARVMSSLLYGVQALDAATFVGIPALFLAVALLAAAVPAHRATRTDPMRVLGMD
ncbi:MAG TPA: ADOP family duplicated permease [Longimicrobiales bacterium]|jgi:predicted permease